MRPGSQIESLAGGRGRCQEAIAKLIFRQRLEHPSRMDHGGFSVLAEEPDFAINVNRRGGVFAADPLLPDQLSGLRFDATGDPGVADHINQIINQEDRGFV